MRISRLLFFITLIGIVVNSCYSQRRYSKEEYSHYKVYTNLNKALKNKDDVNILVLSSKGLKEFPIEITELKNLKVLNLTGNKITTLPKEIKELQNLEMLDLMKNKLKSLPAEIVYLKNLKRINVAYNEINDEEVVFVKEALPKVFIITEIEL